MPQLNGQQVADFKAAFPIVLENEPMVAHTYLKIGGPARLFLVAPTADEVVRAVEEAVRLSIPWYVIGGGSNLLVSDDGFQGIVVQATDRRTDIEGRMVSAAPGVFTGSLARACADAGLTGFEWGVGVPGTVGGATYGDAGCFGGEMRDVVSSVDAYDVKNGKRVTYSNEECRFGYRESRFKHESHIILKTTLALKRGDVAMARAKIDEIMQKRKDSQPQGAFSAGCLFKNFEYADESALDILKRSGDEIPPQMLAQKRLAAGWLIDKLGLKGTIVGKAQVSPIHGNFLVNLGGARAQDVLALSSMVKMKVRDELGILLEDEVQYLGF
ncbi:MAG: UDP-N-acetylmuramate dehydrogenase [Patescibacteria group bacterium]